jgi:hypothetical protein
MNMKETEIVKIALENLLVHTGIKGEWKNSDLNEYDGNVILYFKNNNVQFFTQVRKELRQQQLSIIEEKAEIYSPFMVIAELIFPKIKEELRQQNIAYIESNGNIYVNNQTNYIWIETQKSNKQGKEKVNRAFTKTGLKLLFNILLCDELINLPYREIARLTGIAFANINYIINGLKEKGFIIQIDKKHIKLVNKTDLLRTWVDRYDERLKPDLHIGNFRFLDQEDFINWEKIALKPNVTLWGGEPAGYKLTKHLNPEILTIYTREDKTDLIKNYKLIPDAQGNVRIYRKFWPEIDNESRTVPPLLVYADLINTYDKRNIETANLIYDEYIKTQYK